MPGRSSPAEPHPAMASAPFWSPGTLPQVFRFRSRTEPMDWRRMAAVDVERVAREMDVSALQEFVSAVTFCDVEGERCPNCRSPTDGALIKVLRMSQLSTEYLLHCQDCLSVQVSALEEQLQGALSQARRAADERARLEKELQEVKLENRRRKKMIATQQLLLQASANNYHKCQFCEKSFVNYSYLQSHVVRRHPEVTEAERQKKRQVEQVEDGIQELKEKLQLTQSHLAAEREADAHRRQQKLQELERREMSGPNLRSEDEHDEERRWMREKELTDKMAQKKNEWRKKLTEMQNRHQQEKEQLQSENMRLQDALSSSHALKQQVTLLTSQLTQKDRLIHSHVQKIKKLSARSLSEPPIHISQNIHESAGEEEDEEKEERLEDLMEAQHKVLESLRGNPDFVNEFRPIMEEALEERLEKLGLRKGTKGISRQTLRSLGSERTAPLTLSSRGLADLQDLRENLVLELNRRVRQRQKNRGKSVPNTQRPAQSHPNTLTQQKRHHGGLCVERSPKAHEIKHSPHKAEGQLTPIPAPRSKAAPQTHHKKSSTPPFSSEEDVSAEDSAYITSSRGKPSPSAQPAPPADLRDLASELDWSDSEGSGEPEGPSALQEPTTHGSLVQTLTKTLERQLSSSVATPAGGTRVLRPASSPRPSIVKQQAVSVEESDLELSSIEELTPAPTPLLRSTNVSGTSGASTWQVAASRGRGW
ncbi:cilium assembly protein DZIP1L isoform X3 [Brachyhypopomus gauderio]|uniref:cilium assembly protein DZIP1L isoform X3 n=1 Tax=Brachyhypopomus gauderio TaxID=698409 RepID=UPI004040F4C2